MEALRGYRTYIVFAVWLVAALAVRFGYTPTGDEQAFIDQIIGLIDHPVVAAALAWVMRTVTTTPPGASA